MKYQCAACLMLVPHGAQVELTTSCKAVSCDHVDETKCRKHTIYAHSDENCAAVAAKIARGEKAGVQ